MPPLQLNRYTDGFDTATTGEHQVPEDLILTSIQNNAIESYGHSVRGVLMKGRGILNVSLKMLPGQLRHLAMGASAMPCVNDVVMRLSTYPNDIMREAGSTIFADGADILELRVQVTKDREMTSIEDASSGFFEDGSPYVAVRISVSPQNTRNDIKLKSIDDDMTFSRCHRLAAHRPLDSFMQARRTSKPEILGVPCQAQLLLDQGSARSSRGHPITGRIKASDRPAPAPSRISAVPNGWRRLLLLCLLLGFRPVASPAQTFSYATSCQPPLKLAAGTCVRTCPAGYADAGRTCVFQDMSH
jgi:hypothetical protein